MTNIKTNDLQHQYPLTNKFRLQISPNTMQEVTTLAASHGAPDELHNVPLLFSQEVTSGLVHGLGAGCTLTPARVLKAIYLQPNKVVKGCPCAPDIYGTDMHDSYTLASYLTDLEKVYTQLFAKTLPDRIISATLHEMLRPLEQTGSFHTTTLTESDWIKNWATELETKLLTKVAELNTFYKTKEETNKIFKSFIYPLLAQNNTPIIKSTHKTYLESMEYYHDVNYIILHSLASHHLLADEPSEERLLTLIQETFNIWYPLDSEGSQCDSDKDLELEEKAHEKFVTWTKTTWDSILKNIVQAAILEANNLAEETLTKDTWVLSVSQSDLEQNKYLTQLVSITQIRKASTFTVLRLPSSVKKGIDALQVTQITTDNFTGLTRNALYMNFGASTELAAEDTPEIVETAAQLYEYDGTTLGQLGNALEAARNVIHKH